MLHFKRYTFPLVQRQPRPEPGPAAALQPGAGQQADGQNAAGPAVDPEVIARRVYELMQQDLRVYKTRRGLR